MLSRSTDTFEECKKSIVQKKTFKTIFPKNVVMFRFVIYCCCNKDVLQCQCLVRVSQLRLVCSIARDSMSEQEIDYCSSYGVRRDTRDMRVCASSFISMTYKIYGCQHFPSNQRWMVNINNLAVWHGVNTPAMVWVPQPVLKPCYLWGPVLFWMCGESQTHTRWGELVLLLLIHLSRCGQPQVLIFSPFIHRQGVCGNAWHSKLRGP